MVACIETTAFLSKTWTHFTSDVQEAWHLVQNWLTKRWIDVMNLFGDLTDEQAAAAKQMADQDFADTAAGIEQRRSGALTEREQRRQSERGQCAEVNGATLAGVAWASSPANLPRHVLCVVFPFTAATYASSSMSQKWRIRKNSHVS